MVKLVTAMGKTSGMRLPRMIAIANVNLKNKSSINAGWGRRKVTYDLPMEEKSRGGAAAW